MRTSHAASCRLDWMVEAVPEYTMGKANYSKASEIVRSVVLLALGQPSRQKGEAGGTANTLCFSIGRGGEDAAVMTS